MILYAPVNKAKNHVCVRWIPTCPTFRASSTRSSFSTEWALIRMFHAAVLIPSRFLSEDRHRQIFTRDWIEPKRILQLQSFGPRKVWNLFHSPVYELCNYFIIVVSLLDRSQSPKYCSYRNSCWITIFWQFMLSWTTKLKFSIKCNI